MSVADYVLYFLGDAGVERAIVDRPTTEGEVLKYCMHLFGSVFSTQTQRVGFEVKPSWPESRTRVIAMTRSNARLVPRRSTLAGAGPRAPGPAVARWLDR